MCLACDLTRQSHFPSQTFTADQVQHHHILQSGPIEKLSHHSTSTYVYTAVIIDGVGSQQGVVVIEVLQELVIGTEQLQVHAGRRRAYNEFQLSLNSRADSSVNVIPSDNRMTKM